MHRRLSSNGTHSTPYQSGQRNYLIMQRILPILCCLVLASCATVKPKATDLVPSSTIWNERVQQIENVTRWTIIGGIAANDGKQGWTAALNWRQVNSNYQLRLFGPIGTGQVHLKGNSQQATLKTSKGETLTANSAEALLLKATGWRLPVNNLFYWVRGIPAPGPSSNKVIDSAARLSGLTQFGWNIRYERYIRIKGKELPRKITLRRERLKLKIIIKDWQI